MGLFDRFIKSEPINKTDVSAALSPFSVSESFWTAVNAGIGATRIQAMSIPTIARARNLICSSVASLPIEQYNKFTGAHEEPNRVINQPDPRVPGSYIYAYLAEDLLFHGVGYGMVMDSYSTSDGTLS